MSKTKDWKIESNGVEYNISVEFHNFTGKHVIYLNDSSQYYETSFTEKLIGKQVLLNIPEKKVYVELRGNKAYCAVDGRYLDSGKPFQRTYGIPWWAWLFVIACFIIPIVTLGGAVPAIIGVLGATLAARASVHSNNALWNGCLAFLITAIAWASLYLFVDFMQSLM